MPTIAGGVEVDFSVSTAPMKAYIPSVQEYPDLAIRQGLGIERFFKPIAEVLHGGESKPALTLFERAWSGSGEGFASQGAVVAPQYLHGRYQTAHSPHLVFHTCKSGGSGGPPLELDSLEALLVDSWPCH